MSAGAALLFGDNRSQHAIDRAIQRLDDWMVLVEPAAIDLDDHLRSGAVERGALELLERIAPDIAVQVLGAG